MAIRDTQSRIESLINNAENSIRSQYISVINQLRQKRSLQELERIIQSSNISELTEDNTRASNSISEAIIGAYLLSGRRTSSFISESINEILDFNVTDPFIVSELSSIRLRISSNFTREQSAIIRQSITDGILQGLTTRQQAIKLRSVIGLTDSQYRFIENARNELRNNSRAYLGRELRDRRFDSTVIAAIDRGEALTEAQITRITERYQQRFVAHRANVIAQTESVRVVNAGVLESYRQAARSGLINTDNIVQTWVTRKDSRVRDSHGSMDGQQVAFGQPFISGNGNQLRYPADPNAPASETINCRCVVTRSINA